MKEEATEASRNLRRLGSRITGVTICREVSTAPPEGLYVHEPRAKKIYGGLRVEQLEDDGHGEREADDEGETAPRSVS